MDRNEILNLIRELACSQGMYGRLFHAIMEVKEQDPNHYEEFMEELEAKRFAKPLDFVLWFEQ